MPKIVENVPFKRAPNFKLNNPAKKKAVQPELKRIEEDPEPIPTPVPVPVVADEVGE